MELEVSSNGLCFDAFSGILATHQNLLEQSIFLGWERIFFWHFATQESLCITIRSLSSPNETDSQRESGKMAALSIVSKNYSNHIHANKGRKIYFGASD